MTLSTHALRWSAGGRTILDGVELEVGSGEFVGLIGPNGSGKSSLLRCLYRAQRPDSGTAAVDGIDVWAMKPRDLARRLAVLTQGSAFDMDYTVAEMVLMGRTPHKGLLDRDTAEDADVVADALATIQMTDFGQQSFATLSGGEKQRVLLARALAQQPQMLVLDEPTTHLDVRFQLEILDIVRRLGITALAALHDLSLAAAFCDRIYVLDCGRIVAAGKPVDVITPALISSVYEISSQVHLHDGQLVVIYATSAGTGVAPGQAGLRRTTGTAGRPVAERPVAGGLQLRAVPPRVRGVQPAPRDSALSKRDEETQPPSGRAQPLSWTSFAEDWPAEAAIGAELLKRYGIAYLGTIRKDGSPRICPITPILDGGRIYAAIAPRTPKCADLRRDGRYVLHALPGQDHEEELCLRGTANELTEHWSAEYAQALVERHDVIWTPGDALFELQIAGVHWAEYARDESGALHPRRLSWPGTRLAKASDESREEVKTK